ncbi:MAG: hypothetical protein I4O51_11685 [Flavobacterium micromati]|nr:hypothetical protein [Flavobacterium micromati]
MTVILKKHIGKKEFEKILTSFNKDKSKKGVDTSIYCGTITLQKDPLTIQKALRDEWE